MDWVAAVIVLLASVVGLALTALTLPGIWVLLAVALVCQVWQPGLFSWWTLAIAGALGVLAELIEFAASAAGAGKAGGTRSGAVGSVIGSLAGAIGGAVLLPIPILGSVAGAVVGAALGALVGERGVAGRTWGDSVRVGRGAAVGRLVAMVVKTGIAAGIGVQLTVAAFVA